MIFTEKNFRIAYLFDFYGEILSEKQQLAVELYYNDDLSLSEVAAQLGISRQGVRDSLKRSETALIAMEEKLGLAGKFGDMLEDINRLKQLALNIEEHPSDSDCVRAWAKEIAFGADELAKRF